MPAPRDPRPHFVAVGVSTETARFQARNTFGPNAGVPHRNRPNQADRLRADLGRIAAELSARKTELSETGWPTAGIGITVRFASFPDVALAIESLEQRKEGIELLNVRQAGNVTVASVWIPEGKLDHFEKKIVAYLTEKQASNGRPIDNQKLIDAISDIRAAVLEDLWTDLLPLPSEHEVCTFEAWISTPKLGRRMRSQESPEERLARFRDIARREDFTVGERELRFPERAVLTIRGSVGQLRRSAHLLGQLAELRRAPEVASFFMGLPRNEQAEWSESLLRRTTFPSHGGSEPYICILDTGCNNGHPLIASSLDTNDMHSVVPQWGVNDQLGHGTEQAGMALWGDLTTPLVAQGPLSLAHRLESVKIIPNTGSNLVEHFGPITAQAVSLPEISFPRRRRIFAMAVTSTTTTQRGRPSAWSAEIDALASDSTSGGDNRRLLVVSAGNVTGLASTQYPALNATTPIEDPAQAWNALTVGALTHKIHITEASGYQPVAGLGELSPYSSTSESWEHESPIKPEIVFEGGNQGDDGNIVSSFDSLSLLTTHHLPLANHFTTSFATSAATALASRFSAQIMAAYPNLWPESVRGLMVHSAEWTPGLLTQFPGNRRGEVISRLRHCGWGEPDLDRALYSGADSLTLIFQGVVQPFYKKPRTKDADGVVRGGNVVARDMHLHRFPWPVETLQSLGETELELRITLSYFVEPNPGERGRNNRYTYASHGLRFALQSPAESTIEFHHRINLLADQDGELDAPHGGEDARWLIGPRKRFRGSLHHDRLRCSAVELASSQHIAVYPVTGWWKTREAQERFENGAPYTLIVSIEAPNIPTSVDLYTQIENRIATTVNIAT